MSIDLIATRAFERADLVKNEGDWFAVDDRDVADHLIKIAEVARKPTAEEIAARSLPAKPAT